MTILELRPDRRLVDDNFTGYFLSLTSIPSYSISLECDVDQVFPSDEQYSYIHTKLFSLHNHLFHDPWFSNSLFYIDQMWKVQKLQLNESTEVLDRVQEVWEIPSNHNRVPGHYPTTMLFPASDLVLVADGAGTLHIVSRQNEPWQVKYGEEVLGNQKSFVMVDSRCETSGSSRSLHTILLHLVTDASPTTTDKDKDESPKTYTYLEWLTHAEEASGGWSLQCVRQLKGMGLPDYLSLEPGCKSIYIASEHPFKFISDTENPVAEETEKNVKEKKGNIYMWQQNAEEVRIWFTFEDQITKQDIKVQINDLNFSLEYKGKNMLQGTLFQNVDNDLTSWTIEQNRLNVICQKLEQGLMWKELLRDNNDGEEILDENVIQQVHERLAHLCSDKQVEGGEMYGSTPAFNMEQLEECDHLGESQVLSRLDATTHLVTHQYSLAGHQWLFSVKLNVENAPALCIRHDVHGCLWQPELMNDSADWTCTHLCTFPAFGYVSASKQNRKFLLCAVDMSYTVICEANNHIYVYYKDTTTELRNRRSGNNERTQAGKLHCIKMDTADSILGAFSAGSHLYLLAKNTIYQYHIIIS